ncbi:MAG: DUF4097 family beta strand repeat protein [Clostridia bacterium]|nr:DUF4097 family beta strand repeat protein [Clostridia bacterium]MBQ4274504.1 DUF4097 family beta strand repeat protein [Clostridia bacterium]
MTKAEFIAKLNEALSSLSVNARQDAILFFTEQIDDLIDEGKTEDQAVDALGDFHALVAALYKEEQASRSGENRDTQTVRGESNRPEARSFTTDKRPSTIVLTETNCAVQILPSPDHKIHLEYEITRQIDVTITCDHDRLTYTAREIFPVFHFHIFGRKPVSLYLPADYLPDLEIKTGNAPLRAGNISCDTANFKTGNASLSLAHITAKKLTAQTSNAPIRAEHFTADLVKLNTSNASLTTTHCTCSSLSCKTSNGTLLTEHCSLNTLNAVTSNGKNTAEHITADIVNLTSSNGTVRLQNAEVKEITLITSNGSINAILPGSIADYRIDAQTSNGKSSLPPHKATGEKSLKASTRNGKINVMFNADQ